MPLMLIAAMMRYAAIRLPFSCQRTLPFDARCDAAYRYAPHTLEMPLPYAIDTPRHAAIAAILL